MPGQENGRAADRVGIRVQHRPPGTEARAGKFPGPSLIPVLTAIQREHGWLPREELVKLAQESRRPLYEIEGLISFYPHFRTAPPAKVQLAMCHDLSCWLHGADERIAELKQRYGDDVDVELVEVSCLGRCDVAPAVAVDERPASLAEADALVDAARDGEPPAAPAKAPDRTWPNDPYEPGGERYGQVRRMLAGELDPDAVTAAVTDSGLRGMGGAGLPDRPQVAARGGPGGDAEVRDLQRGRVRAGHLQGPPDHGRAAAPRDRGPDDGDARDGRGGGLDLHPPRVRAGGGGAARRARGARARRGCSAPTPAAPGGACGSRSSPRPAATSSARSRR